MATTAQPKLFPLVGSIFGKAIRHHDGPSTEMPWCEECMMDRRDLEQSRRRTRTSWEDNPILKGVIAKRSESCWERTKRPVWEVLDTDHNGQKCQHAHPELSPCPQVIVKRHKEVRTLIPGHMLRCGIPWSKAYAPKGYRGVLMQDFLVTIGRRYVSPNYWTTNGGPGQYVDRVCRSINGKWTQIRTYERNYGFKAPRVAFPSLDASVPWFRDAAEAYRKQTSKRDLNVDPYRLEAAFYQWVRLGKRATNPNRITFTMIGEAYERGMHSDSGKV